MRYNLLSQEKKDNKRVKPWQEKIFPFILILAISFSLGYLLAVYNFNSVEGKLFSHLKANGEVSEYFDANLYWQTWHTIKNEHVDRRLIDEEAMFYGSLRGMTSALNDPYTIFLDPTESKEFMDDLSGSFEGIGAEVGIRDDMVTVIAPLSGMPAEKAGLRAGDKIYEIDGLSTINMTLNEAVRKIRGPKDTEVVLTLIREGEDKPLDISIVRGTIIIESVSWEKTDDNLFLIKISNFHEDTISLLNQAILDLLNQDIDGIILDLRNNPGGYLDTAIKVASEWIPEGPVLIEQFSDGRRNEFFAQGLARLSQIPTVVLVNKGSASGSEIVAGALRDYKKATVVGEQTFGKGSVQSIKPLKDGSSLKITIAKWYTPGGDYIDEKGVEPDLEVELSFDDYEAEIDPQMEKAIELLLKP
jgi:carboxyl-terminal processing protease